jgi:hypothetical protein
MGMNANEWDNTAIERWEGLAQDIECIGLNGGPWAIQTVPPVLVRIKLK